MRNYLSKVVGGISPPIKPPLSYHTELPPNKAGDEASRRNTEHLKIGGVRGVAETKPTVGGKRWGYLFSESPQNPKELFEFLQCVFSNVYI